MFGKFFGGQRFPKGKHSLNHVWDPLLAWKADRDRRRRLDEKEFQRRVVLAADVLITTAIRGFVRGLLWGIGILALLPDRVHPSKTWGVICWWSIPCTPIGVALVIVRCAACILPAMLTGYLPPFGIVERHIGKARCYHNTESHDKCVSYVWRFNTARSHLILRFHPEFAGRMRFLAS